jgi:methionyl-tRNA synthetase
VFRWSTELYKIDEKMGIVSSSLGEGQVMDSSKRNMLATIALPYANGPLHLGHLVEAIQADIWVRFQRAQAHTCYFISGSDAHGTAVMLSAEKLGVTPEQRVEDISQQHQQDFRGFNINFDHYHTTHSSLNKELAESIYLALRQRGDIVEKTITQAFDAEKSIFLSDRYIKGECPKCHAPDQYGDNCEVCGATYAPMEMKNPVSVLSGKPPVEKESLHYFFRLEHYREFLQDYLDSGCVQSAVANKLKEWFSEKLRDWDISRDAPYFGFKIPGAEDKYFYVWLDAPIGYIASSQALSKAAGDFDWQVYWQAGATTELHHFIGKDIVYFHSLFWPSMLQGSGYRLPTRVNVHGYLTVNGEKMSKSRGTFITANDYLRELPADCLRYYYAAKLNPHVEDIDLNLADFMSRVNSDLVGKFVNLASRCAGFITKHFEGMLASELDDVELYQECVSAGDELRTLYDELEYNKAMRLIMSLADKANQYIDQHKPWALMKQEGQQQRVQMVCTQGINMFRVIATFLSPVLVETTQQIEEFLNITLHWHALEVPLTTHTIEKFKPLMQRIKPEDIEKFNHERDVN